ncbi:MAG: hypothetical protein LUH14_10740 [Clostridiaceae bacterium]|nr:hypothetical protein [Clostridiaceae bacterium]
MGQQVEDVYRYRHNTTTEISRGGQGVVYRTQNPDIAVKVELDATGMWVNTDTSHNEKFDELRLLPIDAGTHITLPRAVLKDVAGYVMVLLDDMGSFEKIFGEKVEYEGGYWEQYREQNEGFFDFISQYLGTGGEFDADWMHI